MLMQIDANIETLFNNETELEANVFSILNEQKLISFSEYSYAAITTNLEFTKCKMNLKYSLSKKSLHIYSMLNNNLVQNCLKTDYVQNVISFFLIYATKALKKHKNKLSITDIFNKGRFEGYANLHGKIKNNFQQRIIKFILGLRKLKNIIIMPNYESVDNLYLNGVYLKKFDVLILYIPGTKIININYKNVENSFKEHFLAKIIYTIADAKGPIHFFLEPWQKSIHKELLELK